MIPFHLEDVGSDKSEFEICYFVGQFLINLTQALIFKPFDAPI